METDEINVNNNRDARRFEVRLNGNFAVLDYIPAGGNIVFTHTEVPDAFEGQGVGSKLARTALDYARDNELKVIPLCPFVAGYIRRHPEYQPLVWGQRTEE